MMPPYALTGHAGSGKSTLAPYLYENTYHYIEADKVGGDIFSRVEIQRQLKEIANQYTYSGNIEKDEIRKSILKNEKYRISIESIMHPLIKLNMDIQSHVQDKYENSLLEIPLLFQAKWHYKYTNIICVLSVQSISKKRLHGRGGMSADEADAMLLIQSDTGKHLKYCRHIITNTGDLNRLGQIAKRLNVT